MLESKASRVDNINIGPFIGRPMGYPSHRLPARKTHKKCLYTLNFHAPNLVDYFQQEIPKDETKPPSRVLFSRNRSLFTAKWMSVC